GMLAVQRGAQEACVRPEHRGPQGVRVNEGCGLALAERQGFSGEALGLLHFGMHDRIAQALEDLQIGRMPGRMSLDLLEQREKRAAGMRHTGKRRTRKPVLTACQVGERSEEHTSELQSRSDLVCRLLLEKKNKR